MVKRRYSGSFTVEAAFVMPIVLIVIFSLIYLGFYLYDNLTIQMVMERNQKVAARQIRQKGNLETKEIYYEAINEKIDSKKLESELENQISRELKQNLFITEVSEINADIGWFDVKVTYKSQLNIPMGNFVSFFTEKEKKKEVKVMIYNPMKVIRSIGGIVENEGGI